MATLTLRIPKDSPLTMLEMDNNLTNINNELLKDVVLTGQDLILTTVDDSTFTVDLSSLKTTSYTAYFGGHWLGTGGNDKAFAIVNAPPGTTVIPRTSSNDQPIAKNIFVVPATGTITKIAWTKSTTVDPFYVMRINSGTVYGDEVDLFQCTSGDTEGVITVNYPVTEGNLITIENESNNAWGDAGFCLYIS